MTQNNDAPSGNAGLTVESDRQRTQARVDSFRAGLRSSALDSGAAFAAMAVCIHEIPAKASASGSMSSNEAPRSSHDVKQDLGKRFMRNALMGTALMSVAIWAVDGRSRVVNDAQGFRATSLQTQQFGLPGVVNNAQGFRAPSLQTRHSHVSAPALNNTSYVLSNDLSKVSEADVRNNLNYVNVTFKGEDRQTLDAPSRLLLSKWASDSNGLTTVGLNWKVLYGVIHAESTWVPQEGMGKNGVKSHGLAQFEGATAKGYGLTNAYDPLAAVSAAAALIRDAAQWTQTRLARLPLHNASPEQTEQALNEGVSVAYNTGWKTRHAWSPENSQKLPEATRTHIVNVKAGAMIADHLAADIRAGMNVRTPSNEMQSDARLRALRMLSSLRLNKAAAANRSTPSTSSALFTPSTNGALVGKNTDLAVQNAQAHRRDQLKKAELAKQLIDQDDARSKAPSPDPAG